MDTAKKMMEKWGWKSGQGIGKDNKGMTSCLVLRKQDGSSTQGRIEKAPEVPGDAAAPPAGQPAQAAADAPAAAQAEQAEDEAAAKRRRRSKWEGGEGEEADPAAQAAATPAVSSTAGTGSPEAAVAALAGAAPPAGGLYDIDPRDAEAAVQAKANAELQAQLAMATAGVQFPNLLALGKQVKEQQEAAAALPGLAAPRQRVRIRQYVKDDWRWSKGTEALRYFEEVRLAPNLLDLARQVLGATSRYPARIADDTDCVTEVTAWGTLIVRPRGTGANVALAKRMLYEVLHPNGESLREDALITPDEMAEAAIRDQSTIATGADEGERLTVGVKRSAHGDLRRVGLGAEKEAMEEAKVEAKRDAKEIELPTPDDVRLVSKHLDDLRMASGALVVLANGMLKLLGKDKAVRKAEGLIKTLLDTGEWVALTEGFVMSEETKEKRRACEGPAEQILIKVPEGPVTQKIEKHLKAMERAAAADELKLTSKAVAGKRTLLVDGTRAAHERVKLMVKELSEKGESPMLSKAIGFARSGGRAVSISALSPAPLALPKAESVSIITAPGVVQAPAILTKQEQEDEDDDMRAPSAPALPVKVAGLGPGPAMRHLPKPRLASDMVKGEDLFAGLPAATAGGATGAKPAAEPFPPLPPATGSSLPSLPHIPPGVNEALAHLFPPAPPGVGVPIDISRDAMAAAEQELLQMAADSAGKGAAGITE